MKKKGTVSEKSDSGMLVDEQKAGSCLNGSEQPSEWVGKPDNAAVIDDCFYVNNQRGTYVSVNKDGTFLVTSLTEEECISSTRWYLKAQQDGFPTGGNSYTGAVESKL